MSVRIYKSNVKSLIEHFNDLESLPSLGNISNPTKKMCSVKLEDDIFLVELGDPNCNNWWIYYMVADKIFDLKPELK